MSLDVHGRLFMGIRVKRSEFLAQAGTRYECPRCRREASEGEHFCPKDGQQMKRITIEEPTAGAKALAESWGVLPERVWDELHGNEHDGVRIWEAYDFESGHDNRAPDREYVLGYRLAESKSNRFTDSPSFLGRDLAEIVEKVKPIRRIAETAGIPNERAVEVFTSTRWSS